MMLGMEPCKFEVYNDIDGGLVNLFRTVRNRPAEFLLELDLLPLNSREEFEEWKRFETGEDPVQKHLPTQLEIIDRLLLKEWAKELKAALQQRADYRDVRWAAAFFMRTRNSFYSSGKSFACQPFNVRSVFDQLKAMSKRLANVIIENQSFDTLIPHYDREDAFFYGDPPYFNSEYVYEADFGWEQHVLLRDTLAKCKGKWLISQADFPEVRELFKGCYFLDFQRIHSMVQKNEPGKQFPELLIANYDLLEQERSKPDQMSLDEIMGLPIDTNKILKERIIPCKNRTISM